ncbi:MAG: ferrous iron transport protein A [Planctomycetes bacterium]|nr:ferrous iron transport protein A [Planctomycetota bacterium]
MTLDRLRTGTKARIVDVQGDDAIATRILEMGMTEGEPIEMVGHAPLGDPIEYSVRGYRLSLRKAEARRVIVEPSDAEPSRGR